MKVYLLHHGEYEQRGVSSVHSSMASAVARENLISPGEEPDIQEMVLDEPYCSICGWDKDCHPGGTYQTKKHEFTPLDVEPLR